MVLLISTISIFLLFCTQKPGNRGWKLERQMMTWKVKKRQQGTCTAVAETAAPWSPASRGLKRDRSGRVGGDLGIALETRAKRNFSGNEELECEE